MSSQRDRRASNAVHPNDDSIERYVLGHLAERELPGFEEHLLICQKCRVLVTRAEPYISAMRQAMRSPTFDVFLCHNTRSKPTVKNIGKRLKRLGLRPWLDEWELRPGVSWQHALEDQIATIRSAAVFISEDGMGPWQDRELEAFLREFVERNCPVIPVILPPIKETALPLPPSSTPGSLIAAFGRFGGLNADKVLELPVFLRGNVWVDFRKNTPKPLDQLVWGITGSKAGGLDPRYWVNLTHYPTRAAF